MGGKPRLHKKRIYKLVCSPLGVAIPTYDEEHFQRVQKECRIEAKIYTVCLCLAAASVIPFLFLI